MQITMVAAECAPIAKAGGLGDFVHGLARGLAARGRQVQVIVPRYDCLRLDCVSNLQPVGPELWVPYYDERIRCDVQCGQADGIRVILIGPSSAQGFFDRGVIYGEPDDLERFAFFSRALLEYLHRAGERPDVIHCNDWHTALVPVLVREVYTGLGVTRPRLCTTLHNLGYQGVAGASVLRQVGLDPERMMTPDRLLDPHQPTAVNLLKGGILYSDSVTTVSPSYAREILGTEVGMGLQETLRACEHKFAGVLNGIDYDTWNPQSDPKIARGFWVDSLPNKAVNKMELRRRLGLSEVRKPIAAVVSRLDQQKGMDLMVHAMRRVPMSGGQAVLLGAAQDPEIDARFRVLQGEMKGNPDCHLELGYDEELAHQIYAAADLVLIPSLYEPCGLTQMIAMRYGAVPVARRVGGLADTVFDANYGDKAFEERNGYLFDHYTQAGLDSALDRALWLWFRYPEYFRQLRINGMRTDHSWDRSVQQYLDLYDRIRR